MWKHQKFSFPSTTQQGQKLKCSLPVGTTSMRPRLFSCTNCNRRFALDGSSRIHLRSPIGTAMATSRIQPMTMLFYMWFGRMLRCVGTTVAAAYLGVKSKSAMTIGALHTAFSPTRNLFHAKPKLIYCLKPIGWCGKNVSTLNFWRNDRSALANSSGK